MKKLILFLLFFNLIFSIFALQELQVTPITYDPGYNAKICYIYSTIPNLRFYPYGETFEFDYVKYDSLEAVYEIYDPDITYRFTIRGTGFVEKEGQIFGSDNEYKVEAIPLTCAQNPGTVLINTTPAGANIYFKTRPFGDATSPFIFKGKKGKINSVTISKKNYHSVDTTFVSDENSFTVVDVTLEPLEKKAKKIIDQQNTVENFIVDFEPRGSQIILNGEFIGYTPLKINNFWTGIKHNTDFFYKISKDFYFAKSGSFNSNTLSTIKLEGELEFDSLKYKKALAPYETNSHNYGYSFIGYIFNSLKAGCYFHLLQSNHTNTLSIPGWLDVGEYAPILENTNTLNFGFGYSVMGHFAISKDFYLIDYTNLKIFLFYETNNKRFKSQLSLIGGYTKLNEFKKEYLGNSIVYGKTIINPDGSHIFDQEKNLDNWVPGEINFALETKLFGDLSLSLIAGGWFITNSDYSSNKHWFYQTEIDNWKYNNSNPEPDRINEKIGLSQKYTFFPYIGIGINYQIATKGHMAFGY